jgi:hypothetical protein
MTSLELILFFDEEVQFAFFFEVAGCRLSIRAKAAEKINPAGPLDCRTFILTEYKTGERNSFFDISFGIKQRLAQADERQSALREVIRISGN